MSEPRITIGVPAESAEGERRVALVPDAVAKLAGRGLDVVVEPNAGAAALIPDALYLAAGADLDRDPWSCTSSSRSPHRPWRRSRDAAGKGTNDETAAAKDPKSGEPAANPARNIWVTEPAATTGLNTAYFAESTATFVIAMGIALLLTGIGFLVLTLRVLYQPRAVGGGPVSFGGERWLLRMARRDFC